LVSHLIVAFNKLIQKQQKKLEEEDDEFDDDFG